VVVDLPALLGQSAATPPTRFVSLKSTERPAALAVTRLEGLHTVREESLTGLPPLLRELGEEARERIGSLDGKLLWVLKASRLVPEGAWAALEGSR
jgi:chemotaxis signal transduction protein